MDPEKKPIPDRDAVPAATIGAKMLSGVQAALNVWPWPRKPLDRPQSKSGKTGKAGHSGKGKGRSHSRKRHAMPMRD